MISVKILGIKMKSLCSCIPRALRAPSSTHRGEDGQLCSALKDFRKGAACCALYFAELLSKRGMGREMS